MQRNQEILAALDLLEPVAATGGYMKRMMVHAYGANFGPRTMHLGESPYPDVLLCGQQNLEAQVAARLASWGVEIEFDTELVHLEQSSESVIATLRSAGQTHRIECKYVVGCDGGNGVSRRFTKHDFTPKKTGVLLRQVDCKLTWRRLSTMDQMWLFYFNRGFAVVVPLPGGVHRVITAEPKDAVPNRDPTLEEMQEKLREVAADPSIVLADLAWASFSDLSMGIASGLRDGRILLAGDVGNPILPNGGQGMNTGISDAFNVGWKLASVLRGGVSDDLLDTYAAERHALRSELETSQYNSLKYTTLATPGFMQFIFRFAGEFALARGGEIALARMFSQLALDTRKSALTRERMRTGGIRGGDRVRDADVTLGTRAIKLFDVLYAGSWTLLGFGGTSPGGARRVRDAIARVPSTGLHAYEISTESEVDPTTATLYDLDQVAHRAYGVIKPTIYLIRPDGYVAARVGPRDVEYLLAYVRRWIPGVPFAFEKLPSPRPVSGPSLPLAAV